MLRDRQVVQTYLSCDDVEALKRLAATQSISTSALVRQILKDWLGRQSQER